MFITFPSKRSILRILLTIYNLYSIQGVASEEKCFDDIGCFSCDPPFTDGLYRPSCKVPEGNLSIRYLLFTQLNRNESFFIGITNDSIATSPFDGSLPTKLIIPGFNTTLNDTLEFYRIKDELLKESAYNVIIIDWTKDDNYPYVQAVANGRAVAVYVTQLLEIIKKNKGIAYESVHIIGHSLGAHIAGWIGERLNKIGRITGLDPAGPFFQHASDEVRLDKTDAKFVDIIHTNGGSNIAQGFGLYEAIGHVDFYPNGGTRQPGCGDTTIFNVIDARTCAHTISLNYFKSSIAKCKFPAANCKNYRNYNNKECYCNNSIMDYMGFHAKKIQDNESHELKFYLYTTASPPYCHNTTECFIPEKETERQGFVLVMIEAFLSLTISSIQKLTNILSKIGSFFYSAFQIFQIFT
ncbi:pancreatic triacylglycerol lipase-like [Parasteatoda tepidariorum]|uniref:pancreatic triacylglycerol lipase-like n=1 Tax=Parasteatoda tepidariorum TaxID=114398 RepID=UPI001C71ECE2|nr:pancreatic triacylglycerol lipase-like [Parasteatoda tepidariorum]